MDGTVAATEFLKYQDNYALAILITLQEQHLSYKMVLVSAPLPFSVGFSEHVAYSKLINLHVALDMKLC